MLEIIGMILWWIVVVLCCIGFVGVFIGLFMLAIESHRCPKCKRELHTNTIFKYDGKTRYKLFCNSCDYETKEYPEEWEAQQEADKEYKKAIREEKVKNKGKIK